MALNTEIDALLAEAAAQGLTIEQLLVQTKQRYDSTEYPDEYPSFSTSAIIDVADWPDLHDYMAEATTMPLETAWARMWAAESGEDQGIFLLYMMQVIRVMNNANQYNPSFPSFGSKSLALSARAYFSF